MTSSKNIEDYYNVKPEYIPQLYALQVELLKLQKHIKEKGLRLAILFEGRDTAGKGSAISRFSQFLNPQLYKAIALGKPTKLEQGQWYFQRHIKNMPNAGRIVFFDRSWYNRAVVEPVMGFCTEKQHKLFMQQVNHVERMLVEDGVILVKFWFSVDMSEQARRIAERLNTPLIQWKVSPVDLAAQSKWDDFSSYKSKMFKLTSTDLAPWVNVKGESREDSRIQSMKYVLSLFEYENKILELCDPDTSKVKKLS